MKARKMLGMWLALALVAVAGLVLTGCPHNNLMDRGEAVGGGSGRSGNKGVQLVITNFIQDTGSTASYLNPLRTISPDHIDLKDPIEVEKYVFIVKGTGNGTSFGPSFITIDDSGVANLGIGGVGFWEIEVKGYAVDKLGMGDKGTITTTNQPQNIDMLKDNDALVLQGQATLDLNTGARVTMTLTNDGVGTDGDVNLTINFDADDVQEINTKTYVVRVALYDYADGGVVSQTTGGHAENDDPKGGLSNPETFSASVKKGHYQLRLTVTDDTDNSVKAYWTDDIYVEGNRDTKKEVNVHNLFGTTPKAPDSFNVFWAPADESELKDGFLATFTWSGLSYNTVGVDIQIADITQWYQYATGHKVTGLGTGGDIDINNQNVLWEKIDDGTIQKDQVVTEILWNNSPQGATKYPAIWKKGSQLNGSSEVTFLMQHGHVYTARIRATGAQTSSDWVVVGTMGTPPVPTPAASPTKFDLPATNGLFDLVQIKYDLENGKYLLYKNTGNGMGTPATKTDLLQHIEYDRGAHTPIDITLKYTDMTGPGMDDWFLYYATMPGGAPPARLDERIMTWDGWKDVAGTGEEFTKSKNTWDTGYTGHKSLHLVALAGSSVTAQAETSGTFNVLDKTNVLVQIRNDDTDKNPANDWMELVNGDDNPQNVAGGDAKTTKLALLDDGVNNRSIINLDKTNRNGGTGGKNTWLYVSAGSLTTTPGTLQDANNNDFAVKDITVTLSQGGVDYKTFTKDAGGYSAHAQLDGLRSGDYTLRVKILTSSGYEESYQTTLVVKYDDQVIQ